MPISEIPDAFIEHALVQACVTLNDQLRNELPESEAGSTMTMALVIYGQVWCVNVGDSRTLLIDQESRAIQMSEDAKPNEERFKKSIVKRGGHVLDERVEGCVSVARAFGDFKIQGMTARPKITKQPLGQGLLLHCDGYAKVFTPEQIGNYVAIRLKANDHPGQVVYELTHAALLMGSRDNLSAMLIDRRPS